MAAACLRREEREERGRDKEREELEDETLFMTLDSYDLKWHIFLAEIFFKSHFWLTHE